MTDVVTNLDEYRKKRTEEGTWPRSSEDTLEYWKARLRQKQKDSPEPIPPPPPPPKKKMTEQIKDIIWPPTDHPVHPI